ncbi:MAG: sialidase family protein [Kiritimatiellia bacterium]
MKTLISTFLITTALLSMAQQPYAPYRDLSQDRSRHVIIEAGTPEIYQGHATTVLLADGKTMFAVWTLNHGGPCGPLALSEDGGKTWKRVDERLPEEFKKYRNCPAIYRMTDKQGKERLFIFACGEADPGKSRSIEMARVMSEDGGKTWEMMPSIPVTCVMPICSMIQLKDGSYLAQYNDRWPEKQKIWNRVFQMTSSDGGLTWSKATLVAQHPEMNLCEPFLLRSPDGKEICAILRDNAKNALSKLIFSRDEGKTWSEPENSSWGLTGHRHHGVQLKDGRWVIAFRDMAPKSPTQGHFVAWVGSYDEIKKKCPGKRIKLLHSNAGMDCGYAALSLLPDETIFAVTYIKYKPGKDKHSIVGVRFKMD